MTRIGLLVLGLLSVGGCRGRSPEAPPGDLAALVDSLKPTVERLTGLTFREPVTAATRTREQLRSYLIERIDEDMPPERLRGTELTYQLLGLIPDTLRLEQFLVDLLTEQVSGFYDPRTSTLYSMEGADPTVARIVLVHEMVHALQHQYLPLDSILRPQDDDDQQVAAHAVLEGQATLAQVEYLLPIGTALPPEVWTQARDNLATMQAGSPLFAAAPMVIREQLIFPYIEGGDFMMWWQRSPRADTVPFGDRMPRSTEQVLQPERYQAGDQPRRVRFSQADEALFENNMGDLGLRILAAQLSGGNEIAGRLNLGWGGDRFRVYETPGGAALVWYIVWDDESAAARFDRGSGAALAGRSRPNYRTDLASVAVDGAPATRIVIAPQNWSRWESLPQVSSVVVAGH
jgi:hypothetical protein